MLRTQPHHVNGEVLRDVLELGATLEQTVEEDVRVANDEAVAGVEENVVATKSHFLTYIKYTYKDWYSANNISITRQRNEEVY